MPVGSAGGTVAGVVVMGALCHGVVRVQYTKPVGSALLPYQGREVPISRSQFPSFPVILRHYRLCTTDDTQSSQISKHVKKGWETGILGVTLGADPWQIPVF